VNPSGRLAETVPLRLADTPAYLNWPGEEGRVRYGEGVFVGYRYYDTVGRDVAFPFGHGLSYTTFAYAGLEVAPGADGGLQVRVTVTNTGPVRGREVVQVYARDVEARVARPVRELAAFAVTDLEPGQARQLTLDVERRALSFWSVRAHAWVVEAGAFEIAVGASSRDLRLTARVELGGDDVPPPLGTTSTLGEWLDDPAGARLVREVLGVGEGDPLPGQFGVPGMFVMFAGIPMRTLAGFGLGFDRPALDRLVERLHGLPVG